jgi:hypothetical protein
MQSALKDDKFLICRQISQALTKDALERFLIAYFFYQPTPDWSGFWLAKKSEGPSLWRATESWNPVRKSGSFKKNKNFFLKDKIRPFSMI